MAKRWRIHSHDADRIACLERAAGVPPLIAQLLLCRGIAGPDEVRRFLEPKLSALREPEELPGCSQAADLLHEAVAARRRICIYGDYDADGVTGTAILWQCLRLLGAEVSYYIPHRLEEGYGLNDEAIRAIAARRAEMVVTVDCGIASVAEAATARQCGLEMIVTDHHEPGTELPEAAALVHPRLPGRAYPFAGLSGSGVAFKLAWAVCQRASGAKKVGARMRDFLVQAVGLAALGTVADVVPLVDENRILVCHGLAGLKSQPPLGLAKLMKVARLDQKPSLDAEDIAFSLAPRLNAAGRLGQAQLAVELLVTDKPDRADELARYVDQLNASRQTLERSIYLAASKQVKEQFPPPEHAALVLGDRGWHAGVIGIVAGRLAEKHYRPVVLVAWDPMGVKPGVGSGRSVPGFNLHAALEACAEHLLGFGGHAAAAGLRIEEDKLEAFRADFCEHAAAEMAEQDRVAEIRIDAEAPLSAFTLRTVGQIERLSPFGEGNARPLLCASGVEVAGPPKTMGEGGRHLSVMLSQHDVRLRAVAFGGGEWREELEAVHGPVDVAFRPVINTFNGRRSVELHLVDWRASRP